MLNKSVEFKFKLCSQISTSIKQIIQFGDMDTQFENKQFSVIFPWKNYGRCENLMNIEVGHVHLTVML